MLCVFRLEHSQSFGLNKYKYLVLIKERLITQYTRCHGAFGNTINYNLHYCSRPN